jgi:hypothetical protein
MFQPSTPISHIIVLFVLIADLIHRRVALAIPDAKLQSIGYIYG